MKILNKIKNWWKNNQEKNSERYLERKELKEELKEISKDLDVIFKSSAVKTPNYGLERAIFIQNIFLQRKLTQATEGLKMATWILALATIVFAFVAITDSPNSSYIIQILQGIATIVIFFIFSLIAIALIWKIVKSIFKWIKKISRKPQ